MHSEKKKNPEHSMLRKLFAGNNMIQKASTKTGQVAPIADHHQHLFCPAIAAARAAR
jgi:hypothetical protein